jgi:hypothetical protein
LGIFLSKKDSLETKAELLFEAIDVEANDRITIQQFVSAFEDIFRLIVSNVFILAAGNEKKGFLNPNLLSSYLVNLDRGKDLAIATLQRLVFEKGEIITKSDFIEVMCEHARFLSSKGLREFFYESFVSRRTEINPIGRGKKIFENQLTN